MSDRRLGRGLGALAVLAELPLIGQLFFFGDVFDWGWLFFLAIGIAPFAGVAGLALSMGQRDRLGIGLSVLALGGAAVPLIVVWAILQAFQQG